jgi:20S proteasome alpha/beta subunit
VFFKTRYRKSSLKKKSMTCIIAGKCSNGAAIIGDTKVTYDDRPAAYKEKIVSEYPVTIAYAGAEMLYKPFKEFAFKTPLSQQNTRPIVQTSEVFSMYASSDRSHGGQPQFGVYQILGIYSAIKIDLIG